MATKRKSGLGRGFDAIFADNAVEEISDASAAVKLKVSELEPNRRQPRKNFDGAALAELADSIRQHGVLQPLLVRPLPDGGYQIVAGERRWRAARQAGLTEVPAVVRELSDAEVAGLALVENLQREDLNPLEEAQGFRELADKYGYTQEEIAALVGRSRSAVANALRLLTLSKKLRDMVESGALSPGHARALLTVEDAGLRDELAKVIVDNGLSVREAEQLARTAVKTKPEGKKAKKRNPYYDEVSLALGEVLGRRVRVHKSGKSGALEIEFFNDDDLKKLLTLFERWE